MKDVIFKIWLGVGVCVCKVCVSEGMYVCRHICICLHHLTPFLHLCIFIKLF